MGCALLLMLVLASAVTGQSGGADPALSKEQVEQQLEDSRKNLLRSKERKGGLELSIEEIARLRSELNGKLVTTATRIKDSETALSAIEGKIAALGKESGALNKKLAGEQATIAKLLAVLQRMGRNPPPVIITRRDDALGMVRSALMLSAVFPEMRDKALELAADLGQLDTIIKTERSEADRLKNERQVLAAEQQNLDQLLIAKRAELATNEQDLSAIKVAIAEQEKKVSTLAELIDQLGKNIAKTGAIGAYDKQLAEGAAPNQADTSDEADIDLDKKLGAAEADQPGRTGAAVCQCQGVAATAGLRQAGAGVRPGDQARLEVEGDRDPRPRRRPGDSAGRWMDRVRA